MTLSELRSALGNANTAAFLRVIRAGESSQDDVAYYTLFGGETFSSLQDHPRRVVTKGRYSSSAAGAYQFLAKTWDGLVAQYHFPDFSPENQDLAAVALIAGRGALADVMEGRFEKAIGRTGREWASLPGSPYGQPTRTLAQAKAVYEQYGGTYAVQPKQAEVKPVAPLLALLPALIEALPKLAGMFGSGSEVANRNVAAVSIVADAVVKATGADNLQGAIEKIQGDPESKAAANAAVDEVWPSIMESGGGGIGAARKAATDPGQLPPWKNAAIWITVAFLPLIYGAGWAVLFREGFSDDLKTMVVTAIFAGLLGSITGFFLGSSLGSQKKDSMLGAK